MAADNHHLLRCLAAGNLADHIGRLDGSQIPVQHFKAQDHRLTAFDLTHQDIGIGV